MLNFLKLYFAIKQSKLNRHTLRKIERQKIKTRDKAKYRKRREKQRWPHTHIQDQIFYRKFDETEKLKRM